MNAEGHADAPGLEILRCQVGGPLLRATAETVSSAFLSVVVEPREAVTGLRHMEVLHTHDEAGADVTVYGLREYLRQATAGDLFVLPALYVGDEFVVHSIGYSQGLRDLRDAIVSQEVRGRFVQRLEADLDEVLHRRATEDGGWEEAGSEMVRYGFAACELLATGRLTLPLPEDEAAFCLAVLNGEVKPEFALEKARMLEAQAESIVRSPLPEHPDLDAIQAWTHQVYREVLFG